MCSNIDPPMSEERVGPWKFLFSNIGPYRSTASAIWQQLPSSFHHLIHGSHFNSHIKFVFILIISQTEFCVGTPRLTRWLAPLDQWVFPVAPAVCPVWLATRWYVFTGWIDAFFFYTKLMPSCADLHLFGLLSHMLLQVSYLSCPGI